MKLTLEYWPDGDGFVGRLKEVPSVFSQGDTIEELVENIRDAYHAMFPNESAPERDVREMAVAV
jgi:predicted RNase H-like HicB family nuclease